MKNILIGVLVIGILILGYLFIKQKDKPADPSISFDFSEQTNSSPTSTNKNPPTVPIGNSPATSNPQTTTPSNGGGTASVGGQTTIMVPVIILEESNYSTADFGRFGCSTHIKFIPQQVPETQAVLNATYEWLFNNNYQTSQYSNIVPTQQTSLNYQSVEIVNGVAKVYLTGSMREYGCAFSAFAGQIEQAALQYPSVNDIQVYVNGQLFDWCLISQADPEESGCDENPKLWNTQKIFEIE